MPALFLGIVPWKAGKEAGAFPGEVMQSPWSCAPDVLLHRKELGWVSRASSLVTMGSAGHLSLNLGWKQLLKKKYIFAGERRKLRQLTHASRLFQVFHLNQAAILPDSCFEHMPESELETAFVTCGKPKASAFERQMNLVPDWNKVMSAEHSSRKIRAKPHISAEADPSQQKIPVFTIMWELSWACLPEPICVIFFFSL